MHSDEELNRRFYEELPSTYFYHRLTSVVWFAERWSDLSLLLETPTSLGVLQVGGFSDQGHEESDDDRDERERFVATESLVLLHHAGEALLRLFLAHRTLPPVPWIELAALTSFHEFRRELESLAARGSSLETDVEKLFLQGTPDAVDQDAACHFYANLISRLAGRLLTEGNAYNSAKHGLAVRGGNISLSITPEDGDGRPISGKTVGVAHGPSVEHLGWERKPDGRHWRLTTRWIDVPRTVSLTYIALQAIESLWTVARIRYLGEVGGQVWIPSATLDELLPNRRSGSGTHFSIHLGVEHS